MGTMLFLPFQTKDAHGNLHGMPSPVDGNPDTPWPWDFCRPYVQRFRNYGGTVAVFPPLTKGASLGTGYDPFNHYDLGSNSHGPAGRRETRYGSIEDTAAFIAWCRAQGMQTYANVVHHHVDGDPGNWRYDYIAGDGSSPGRFPKDENCFWVWSSKQPTNPDRVFNSEWDMGFGREFRWESGTYSDGKGANGPGYVRRGLADALNWQTLRLDIDGYFLDDAKGTAVSYIAWLLQQQSMAGRVSFVELSDGNADTLNYWMSLENERAGVMDFALRYKMRDVCNSSADMRSILSEGVCWSNPARAITFGENIDLDLSDPIIQRKELQMAMILGFPGYPMLFGKDLYAKPHGYGLEKPALNMVWCHETFAKGDHVWRDTQSDHLIWERMGDNTSSGALYCASIRDDWHKVTVQTKWPNQRLHDYHGRTDDAWTDARGNCTFWMPPDEHGAGRGHVCLAVPGVDYEIELTPRNTTNRIPGAADLDVPALKNGLHQIGQVCIGKGSPIEMRLTADRSGWTDEHAIVEFQLLDPAGEPAGGGVLGITGDSTDAHGVATRDGWHTVHATANLLPDAGSSYELQITYTAPRV